jgi:L-ascorbate metabolism protein UlaG (beta-lactamase superfamily)
MTATTVGPVVTAARLDLAELTADDQPATDDVQLWWLGQAGFALRHRGLVILVDPYLSDGLARKYAGTQFPHRRLHPPPVDPARLRRVAAVLHTHAHTDHLDPDTVAAVRVANDPVFVAPRARRDVALARRVPVDRLVALDAGETSDLDGVRVTALPAAHEELTRDDTGAHHFLGYVIEIGGVRVYHSGDCVPYPGQAELVAELQVDVALLPVNGRDAHRLGNGVPGNFTVDEAVDLCHRAGVAALVCHHFGLFDFNTVDPAWLVERLGAIAGDLEWTVPAVGAGFRLEARR